MFKNPENYKAFEHLLEGESPPEDWSASFLALWWDAKGNWEKAHAIAQDLGTHWGDWMHAYLHKKEGDLWNARYWYRTAGMPENKESLEQEFTSLFNALLHE